MDSPQKRKKNRLIDKKTVKQVLVDAQLHKYLKIEAAKRSQTIRELVEEGLAEVLGADKET